MAPLNTLFRAARPAFRSTARGNFFSSSQSQQAQTIRNSWARAGRRWQSTASPEIAQAQSWARRMWDSPIGVKTVHFWAPVMKWALVLAGVSDFYRPAENLSLTQNVALTATGAIWTRWCLIIKPKNVLLATVNFFLGLVGVVQVSRILMHRQSVKNTPQTPVEKLEAAGEKAVDKVKEVVKS